MYSFLSLVLPNHESSPVPLHCRTFPIRGFQIYDGPVRLTQSTFRGYMPTPERYTSAVGFNLKNTWQLTPRNNLSELNFHSTVSRHLGLIRHRTLYSFCSKNSKTPTWPLTTLFSPFFLVSSFFILSSFLFITLLLLCLHCRVTAVSQTVAVNTPWLICVHPLGA